MEDLLEQFRPQVDGEPPESAEVADGEAKLMAMRAQELSPQGRRQVMDLLELVERYERAERENEDRDDGR